MNASSGLFQVLPEDEMEEMLGGATDLRDEIKKCQDALRPIDEWVSSRDVEAALDLAYAYLSLPELSTDSWDFAEFLRQSNDGLRELVERGDKETISRRAVIQILIGMTGLFREPPEESKKLELSVSMLDDVEVMLILSRAAFSYDSAQLWPADRIRETIKTCKEALAHLARAKGDRSGPDQAVVNTMLANQAVVNTMLANAYSDRIRGDRQSSLNQAVKYLNLAVGEDPDEFPQKKWPALAQQNLGNCHVLRQEFEKAERCYDRALQLQPDSRAFAKSVATTRNNWGIAVACRGATRYGKRVLDINALDQREEGLIKEWREEAVKAYREAERMLQETWYEFDASLPAYRAVTSYNLGRVYELWGDVSPTETEKAGMEEKAIDAYVKAYKECALGEGGRFRVVELAATRRLGRLHFKRGAWRKAYAGYTKAIKVLNEVQGEYITEWGRLALARQNARLFTNAAFAHCRSAELADTISLGERDEKFKEALECLEWGQARLLTEMLVRHDAVPRIAGGEMSQELLQEFLERRMKLRKLESELRNHSEGGRPREEIGQDLQDARRKFFDQTVPKIQKIAPDFMVRPERSRFDEILDSVSTDVPTALVYFDVTDQGTKVFVVTRPEVGKASASDGSSVRANLWVTEDRTLHLFSLDDFTRKDLNELLFKAEGKVSEWILAYEDWQRKVQLYEDYKEPEGEDQELSRAMDAARAKWKQVEQEMISCPHEHLINEAGWFVVYQLHRAASDVGNIKKAWKETIKRVIQELHERLFADVDAYLQNMFKGDEGGRRRIILIPQFGLCLLPLHAMQDRQGQYLIERYEITYAPSAAILQRCRERLLGRPRFSRFLGVAVWKSKAERGVIEGEIKEIANLFVRGTAPDGIERVEIRMKTGKKGEGAIEDEIEDATEEEIVQQARDRNFVAFACHGLFNLNDPGQSGLELEDDRLVLNDLYDKVNLPQVHLVTLGACESGLADHTNPAGEFVSLPGGFLYAGAPAVVGSLWMVEPETTKKLMVGTYKYIRKAKKKPQKKMPKMQPSEALCQAQRDLLEQGGDDSHPYYWAPLYLCGGCKGWW